VAQIKAVPAIESSNTVDNDVAFGMSADTISAEARDEKGTYGNQVANETWN
jgi:hypothetical protein